MRNERGSSLGEVMVATLVLSVGIVAVVAGLQFATGGVEHGRGETTATLLAEARLEELKALALKDWNHATLSGGTTTEGYGTMAEAPHHRRVTVIVNSPGGPCMVSCRLVRVTVFYRPVTAQGQLNQERQVDVSTLLVSRG
jgi:Tfp pilus assembly protein PilV